MRELGADLPTRVSDPYDQHAKPLERIGSPVLDAVQDLAPELVLSGKPWRDRIRDDPGRHHDDPARHGTLGGGDGPGAIVPFDPVHTHSGFDGESERLAVLFEVREKSGATYEG